MNELGRRVFLSYTRRDFYLAEEVYADLVSEGVDVWMDMAEIGPGDTWRNTLENAIRKADTVLLVATPRSVSSAIVREEIRLADAFGTPVRVLVAEGCDLGAELAARPPFLARVSRRSPVLALVLAALAYTALCSLGLAAYYLWAALTDHSGQHIDARWSTVPVLRSELHLVLVFGCLAATGVVVAGAAALIRRRWRWTYLLPVLVVGVVLQLVNHYLGRSGPGPAGELAGLAGPLRGAVFGDAVVVAGLLVLLLGSTSVLRRSQTGSGSLVARWMVLRRTDEAFTAADSMLGDHVPFDVTELATLLEPADRVRTFTVVHAAADAPLAGRISEVCRTVGLVDPSPSAPADRQLLLVTNNTDVEQVHRSAAGERGIPVLACSLGRVTDSDLMQRQWVDFRNGELNLREIARVTDRRPKEGHRTRTVVPVAATTCRLPFAVAGEVRALTLVALGFTLVVLSNTYWNVLGARTSTARLVLAMGVALLAVDVVRLILERRASARQVRLEKILLAAMGVAFALVTVFDPPLWIGHRFLSWAIAGWLVTDPFLRDKDLRAWLPTASAPAAPPALGFPLTLASLLISPWFYAVLMLAGATTLVSPL